MMKISAIPDHGTIFENHQFPRLVYFAHSTLGKDETTRHIHSHANVTEIIFIKSGKGKHIIDGITYTSEPGDILVYHANTTHEEYALDDTVEELCCGFKNIHIKGLNPGFIAKCPPYIISNNTDTSSVHTLMELIEQSVQAKTDTTGETCYSLGISIVVNLYFLFTKKRPAFTEGTNIPQKSLGQQIRKYVDLHFSDDLSLPKIAELFHVSPSYASRVFQREIGCTFVQYRLKRRIGEAETLLTETDYPISYIGSSVGFDNTSYFVQAFSRVTGQTPSDYRYQSVGTKPIFKKQKLIR